MIIHALPTGADAGIYLHPWQHSHIVGSNNPSMHVTHAKRSKLFQRNI